MADPNAYFKKGALVEISSDEPDFRGAWFLGTVISRSRAKQKNQVFVQYHTLMSDHDETKFLREKVDVIQLRPPAPREMGRAFSLGEEVDAYHLDGWWEGVITRISGQDSAGGARYSVYFRGTREELDFGADELRLHREWVRGEWVPPFEFMSNTNVEEPSKNAVEKLGEETFAEVANSITNVEEPCIDIVENFGKGTLGGVASDNANEESCIGIGEKFRKGAFVEITSDEDGFQGAWFAATMLEKLSSDEYMVEYQSLTNDDGTELLKEKANIKHIRPFPPETAVADYYSLLQEVDALYNDGWWVGVISKVLQGKKYLIYFRGTNEEMEFNHSDLRPHQDWIDGKWVMAPKVARL
ncbi:hypothetical protein DCAR_0102157 [Daucus carota subsp. sativus]|uniref:Agenet domain-containing protein n=1 Tax=Daucus carota subsp. sativus TaxID=79200 RepID=A0AAF0W4J8_DAUCS|nr:PREDICTED: DUF724 domain-containing protein 3-like [Daucus carota subsp. sativus]WOG82984.1 hypothetical protein DCAR_0102157 [Daucus carota subsp. sativus]